MKQRINLKTLLVLLLFIFFANMISAQQKNGNKQPAYLTSDNLTDAVRNSIYNIISDSDFRSKSYISTFTVLKIEIDDNGGITSINFSDGVDTLFAGTFLNRPGNYKTALAKYVKANLLHNVSILIPIDYEPFHSSQRNFYYQNMESLIKFNKKDFTGTAIILSTIKIRDHSEHNM